MANGWSDVGCRRNVSLAHQVIMVALDEHSGGPGIETSELAVDKL